MIPHTPGTLVLVSAPSGGGKNAVIAQLLQRFPVSTQLITTTTRPMRAGERDGVDYYFIERDVFLEKLRRGEFVEHNEYAGNLYGTEWEKLRAALDQYTWVFSQAEVNGKQSLDRLEVPHTSIFLLPESIDVLEKRLRNRGGMAEENIQERLRIAKGEIEIGKSYDLPIVNREGALEETVKQIASSLEDKAFALDKKALVE